MFLLVNHSLSGALPTIRSRCQRLVMQPLEFTLDSLSRYPMQSRMTFVECGGNSAPLFSNQPVQANVQTLHGLVSCAEWTGVMLSTLLEEAGIDPKARWLIAEGAEVSGEWEGRFRQVQNRRPTSSGLLR